MRGEFYREASVGRDFSPRERLECTRPCLLEEEEADGAGEENKAADEKSNADREEGTSGRRVRHDWRRRLHRRSLYKPKRLSLSRFGLNLVRE